MIKINLLPAEYIESLDRKAMIAKAIVAGVVAVALVLFLSVWHFTKEKTTELRLVRLEAELKNLQSDVDRVKAIEAEIAEVQRYLDAINRIATGRIIYTHFMADLASALPGTLWFTSVSTKLSVQQLSANISIRANSAYDLAYWINALETNPKYSDVTLTAINAAEQEGGRNWSTGIGVKYSVK